MAITMNITMDMNKVPMIASDPSPTPAASPIPKAKNMNTMSCTSLTAVLNRIMLIAPTNPKAVARLLPITMMTTAVIKESKMRELTNCVL